MTGHGEDAARDDLELYIRVRRSRGIAWLIVIAVIWLAVGIIIGLAL